MLKILTEEDKRHWDRDGAIWPIDLLGESLACDYYSRFEKLEKSMEGEVQDKFKIKAHLPFPWLWDLVTKSRLADVIEDLIGPNIVCWGSSFFTKKARDPRFVSWHQDSTYYGLDPPESITAWIAFTEANRESGCMKILPGSHKGPSLLPHEETFEKNNLLARGQTIKGIDERAGLEMPLKAGQMSIHHNRTIHSSEPNRSSWPRVGYAVHFAASNVRQTQFKSASAIQIRGEDPDKNWLEDPYPDFELSPESVKAVEQYWERYRTAMTAQHVAN